MTSWGQVNRGMEKNNHGGTLQRGLSSAIQAWLECAVGWNGLLQYLKDQGLGKSQMRMWPLWIGLAASLHTHSFIWTLLTSSPPRFSFNLLFLPQVESWLSHAFAEEVTDIKKRDLISTLSIMQMQLRYVILIWFKTFKTPWATSLIILSSSCLEFQTLLALV